MTKGDSYIKASERIVDFFSKGTFQYIVVDAPPKGKWEYIAFYLTNRSKSPEDIRKVFNRHATKGAIVITDDTYTQYELSQMFSTRKVKRFRIDNNFHGVEVYK